MSKHRKASDAILPWVDKDEGEEPSVPWSSQETAGEHKMDWVEDDHYIADAGNKHNNLIAIVIGVVCLVAIIIFAIYCFS